MQPVVASKLGPIVYTRSDGVGRSIVAILASGLAAYACINETETKITVALLGIALFLVGRCLLHPPRQLRLHQNGISSLSLYGVKRLRTADLIGFQYTSKTGSTPVRDRIVHIAHAIMTFIGNDGTRLCYKAEDTNEWKLTRFQEFAITTIANQMKASLSEQQFVDWTQTLRITSDGIQYRRYPSHGWSNLSLSQFDEHQYTLKESSLSFLSPIDGTTVHVEHIDGVNFFPGYYLLKERYTTNADPPKPVFAWGQQFSEGELWLYGTFGDWW